MLPELQSILESSNVSTQREVLTALKDRIRWQTNRFVERYCDFDPICQICGDDNYIQYHHTDYAQPYKINILCRNCHAKVHNNNLISPVLIDLQAIAIKDKKINGSFVPLKLKEVETPDNYLKLLRTQKGISSTELGKLIGVTASTICHWEKGKGFPRRDAMIKYAVIFNVPFEDIKNYISESIKSTA